MKEYLGKYYRDQTDSSYYLVYAIDDNKSWVKIVNYKENYGIQNTSFPNNLLEDIISKSRELEQHEKAEVMLLYGLIP